VRTVTVIVPEAVRSPVVSRSRVYPGSGGSPVLDVAMGDAHDAHLGAQREGQGAEIVALLPTNQSV